VKPSFVQTSIEATDSRSFSGLPRIRKETDCGNLAEPGTFGGTIGLGKSRVLTPCAKS
jgi:hypothetical protein